jgi:RNA polymerase sigma-70 factor (ECF subfamily)
MSESPSFDELLTRLRRRDERVTAAVFHRFRARLVGLARKHLAGRLLPKIDPDDVVQSVFQSVFRRLAEGQFEVEGWDGLWALLTCVTVRKCGRWVEHYRADRRDVGREAAQPTKESVAETGWEFIDREPMPEEGVMLAETVEELLRGFTATEQQVVAFSLQGYSVAEVSSALGCTESKVYRVLRHVRHRLEQMRS